jgi:hypothetical protein
LGQLPGHSKEVFMNTTKACMGGFCHLREKCGHHMAPSSKEDPAERLCTPGAEKAMFFVSAVRAQQAAGVAA